MYACHWRELTSATHSMRFQRQDAQAPRRKGKTGSEAFLYWLLIGDRNLPCSRPFSVLSADFAAFGEGLFNAEDARGGAEFCRESFSSVTLGEALRDLGVESGCLPVWWRLPAEEHFCARDGRRPQRQPTTWGSPVCWTAWTA